MKIKFLFLGLLSIIIVLFICGCALNEYKNTEISGVYQKDLELTVYEGLGLVKEVRSVNLSGGIDEVKFTDIPTGIDPTSLMISDLSGSTKTEILEQSYDYDLVNLDKLLENYLNKNISIVAGNETITGELLTASSDAPVIRTNSGIVAVRGEIKNIKFPDIPEGLSSRPTLSVLMDAKIPGKHDIGLTYLTSGMTWNADYVCVLDKDDKKIDLSGWITIANNAGTAYKNAKIKIVAGNINRVRGVPVPIYAAGSAEKSAYAPQPDVSEEQLFEYHMYSIPLKTTLKNNQNKQISFLQAGKFKVEKKFIFDTQQSQNVKVVIKFNNSKNNNLGIPIPKGTFRIYKEDSEGKLQFLGEDRISHTPENENISISIGEAFDIAAQRTETDRRQSKCETESEYRIDLRNHKKEDIEVYVVEHPCAYCEWIVLKESLKHETESATKIYWKVPVKAGGNSTITYRILYRYSWCTE